MIYNISGRRLSEDNVDEKAPVKDTKDTVNDEIETVPVDKVKCLVLNDIVEEETENASVDTIKEAEVGVEVKNKLKNIFSCFRKQEQ